MEKNPIHEVTFNLQCVCVQAASSPRLFVVVVYSVTLTVGRGEGKKAFGSICIMFSEMCPFISLFWHKIHFMSTDTHAKTFD